MNKNTFFLYAFSSLILSQNAVAQTPDVNINGFARFEYGFFKDNFKNTSDQDAQMESEIHVKVKNTTESGLEYGAKIQLKASTDDKVAADEVTIWAENKFGRLELGDQDGAADVMAYYAPKTGFGGAVDADFKDWLDGASRPQIGAKAIDSGDSTKMTYYTPRLSGLQIGVSYAPELQHGETILRSNVQDLVKLPTSNGNNAGPATGAAANSDLIDYVQPASFNATASMLPTIVAGGDNKASGNAQKFFQKSYKDFVELGVNYLQKIEDFDVRLALGYTHAKQKAINTDFIILDPNLTSNGLKRRPINAWHAGGQVTWQDLTFGAGYVNNTSSGQLKRLRKQDRKAWNLGLTYNITPVWEIGGNVLSENLGGASGNGNYKAYGLSTAYKLAPGLRVAADFVSYHRSFGSNNGQYLFPGQTVSKPQELKSIKNEDKGHVIILGTEMNF